MHNAIRNLWRNKGRSVLIIIVVTIIAAASTIGFAIVQAAQRARASALENTTISAQISLDRNKIMQSANSSGQKPDMSSFGKAMQEKQLTLDDYEQYAKSEYGVSSSYYIETSSAAAVDGGIEAVDTNNGSSQESSDNANSRTDTGTAGAETEGAMPNDMPRDMGGQNGGPAMTTGDFSLVGFSSDEALENAPNGSFTMDSGKAFDYDASDGNPVLVSKTLADANNLKVGSTFKLANVSDSKKTYTFTVAGIYSNTQESNMPMGGTMASIANDAANAIYMSAATLGKIDLDSTKTLSITDSKGNTRETSATQLSFTYVFDGKTDYDRFTEEVKKAGLSDDCTVSSMDVEQYEQSLVPIDNLSKFAKTMLIVVLSVSAVVLVILTIFNIRERKYEIGVLTAIGVKKWKVSAQFAVELLTVVLIGLIVGTGIGASTSVPVSDALLSSQVASQQSQQESRRAQFGRDMQGAPGAAPDGNAQSAKPNTDNIQGESAEPNDGKQSQSGMPQGLQHASNAIKQVNATVSWATIGWMLLIGLALTLLASVTAAIFVMRYEPLQILADRS
ncbi:ABC transporter permease [Bifidobacterium animalis subsp. animalis MCC 0483]|uniref:ABC transporter permease n=1 Tax=Bifidobacterium animalis subsp. animalis MCC 0483 TaxID=1365955 RepID=A0AB34T8G5_9BIFI|nr:ABC transporter permease [Bifidobacterium animalis subsp. animalis MCC 0483]